MSFAEALCWVLGEAPSRLPKLYWKYSYEDLRSFIRTRFAYEQVRAIQEYENLCIVVSKALGGKPKNHIPENATRPQTVQEAKMALKMVLGGGR